MLNAFPSLFCLEGFSREGEEKGREDVIMDFTRAANASALCSPSAIFFSIPGGEKEGGEGAAGVLIFGFVLERCETSY